MPHRAKIVAGDSRLAVSVVLWWSQIRVRFVLEQEFDWKRAVRLDNALQRSLR